jgi:hypothetical protein
MYQISKITLFSTIFILLISISNPSYAKLNCEFTGATATKKMESDALSIVASTLNVAKRTGMLFDENSIQKCWVSMLIYNLGLVDAHKNMLVFNLDTQVIASIPRGTSGPAFCYDTINFKRFQPIDGKCFNARDPFGIR